ncbi:hypothetical protein E0L93_06215 [Rubrobacter taiwanensis]|jgi:ribosomal protein S6--L-glutamate ligase|uniref:Inositol 1,3,4-trisphosphate 5/6-kinase ATP-grasp domain-containing protein n=1 Tax=Rubrobacter taiwanensis TaxID=185139 RepID=A0A4R1BLL7_9ACTN|nr:hypothetical protein [Rubrobacter taiwanensis]TCJ18331.1 hypothetical protein E0L93_06215 [Rubrobacter taiwanensis]
MLRGRRIELWVEARNGAAAVNPVMRALLDRLEAAGARATVRVPEHELADPREERRPDLALLKSATTLALSRAVVAEASGTRFLNGARFTLRAHDKAATIARLAAAGLPVPETHLFVPGSDGRIPDSPGGWIVKPVRGVHGRGVAAHPDLKSALREPAGTKMPAGSCIVDDGTRLVQRRIGGDEPDVKAYVAGGRIFAGTKRFTPASYAADEIEPVELSGGTQEVVLAAGEALGLRLFGVDLRFESGQPFIIDANPFPGYRGFPEAVPVLLAEIEGALP